MELNKKYEETDQQLISGIQSGNDHAFRKLFDRYSKRLYNFAVFYLSNAPDAEDLVQHVFVKLWSNRYKIKAGGNIKSYIFKIAVNEVYDMVQTRKHEHIYLAITKQASASDNNTWNEIVFDELQTRHDKLVEKMPVKRKEIYLYSRKEGLSNKEIAQKLNISARTVESQIYKALAFLKEHLLEQTLVTTLYYYLFVG